MEIDRQQLAWLRAARKRRLGLRGAGRGAAGFGNGCGQLAAGIGSSAAAVTAPGGARRNGRGDSAGAARGRDRRRTVSASARCPTAFAVGHPTFHVQAIDTGGTAP